MLDAAEEKDFERTIGVSRWSWKLRIKMIVKECILGEFQQGEKAVGSATP